MEMHTDMMVTPAAKRSPKARLLTAGHLDGRTRAAKRARAVAAELEAGFGNEITERQRQDIGRAAAFTRSPRIWSCAGLPVSRFRLTSCCVLRALPSGLSDLS